MLVIAISEHRVSAVLKPDCDNLTPQEIEKNKHFVEEAERGQVKRWHDLQVFRRSPRRESKNRVDGTRVLKWKRVEQDDGIIKSIGEVRLTARGFKDLQAQHENISTVSGIATKSGQ